MKPPDLEEMIQEVEDQAYGSVGLVRALDAIYLCFDGVPDNSHIYPQALQARVEYWVGARHIDPMPGLKIIMARYPHDGMDGLSYQVGKLRTLIDTIKQETFLL